MNDSPCILGIDLGTSSLKCVVIDSSGDVCASATHAYPTSRPQTGWAEQDPGDWIDALRNAIGELHSNENKCLDRLAGIGLCSAAHLPVLLDKSNNVLRPAILWSDQRSGQEVAELQARYEPLFIDASLNEPGCTWTLPQLLWIWKHEPDVMSRVCCLLSSKDYLLFRLTGNRLMDHGSAAATLMLDARTRTWSTELTALSTLPVRAFPELVSPMTVAGHVTEECALTLGLPKGVPVVAGTIDSAAELVGCGMLRPDGNGMIRVGSAGGVMVVTDQPAFHRGVITYPHVMDGLFYKQAGTNSCATSLQWIRELCSGVGDRKDKANYADLEKLAAQTPPGSDGLLFHPYLQGERAPYWNPALRGSFTGLDQRHGWPQLVRAVMEGVAFSLRDCLDMFCRDGMNMRNAVVAGGIVDSEIWMRILTDVLVINTQTTRHGDSAFGASLLAATATGMFDDLAQAVSTCVTQTSAMTPDESHRDLYNQAFTRYLKTARFLDSLSTATNA